MSKRSPPSSISFPLNQEDDDGSEPELTGPCCYGCDFSQGDDYGPKQAADHCYCRTLSDGIHPSQTGKQELLDLKLQIVRQQKKLNTLSSKLSQYKIENEALKVEKEILVDELANAHGATHEQPITTRRGWFSRAGDNGGSMQMLIDINSKLMMDNARLQVMVDALRKSFQSYIKDSRRGSDKDKQTIHTLRRLSVSECTAKTSLASSFTVDNENQEDTPLDSTSQHSIQDDILKNSLRSIPEKELSVPSLLANVLVNCFEQFGTSGDDWIIEGEDIEAIKNAARAAREKRAERMRTSRRNSMPTEPTMSDVTDNTPFVIGAARSRCKSAELLVEFEETRMQKPRRTDERLYNSLNDGSARSLLVNFGETPRPRGIARTWSSLKL